MLQPIRTKQGPNRLGEPDDRRPKKTVFVVFDNAGNRLEFDFAIDRTEALKKKNFFSSPPKKKKGQVRK